MGSVGEPERTLAQMIPASAGRSAEKLTWVVLAALTGWALVPVVYLLARAALHHEMFAGGVSVVADDQLQYLAWVRSSGEHLLAADDFALRAGGHVFLQPMFLLSGLLWRAGVGIALSYLVWLPVAVGVLFAGFRCYTRRMLEPGPQRAAALALAIFFVTPADPLVGWIGGSAGLDVLAGELSPTGSLFGYFPSAIAVGLLPLFALHLEQIVGPARHPAGCSRGWYVLGTAAIGATVSWLHPWQGETLLVLTATLLVTERFKAGSRPLLVAGGATAAPLLYYWILSRTDVAWRIGQAQSSVPRPSVGLLALALAPLVVLAVAGLDRGPRSSQARIVVLWPCSAVLVYFVSPGYAPHALEGLVLPLTVLAVRGWQRLRLPGWLALGAIIVATVPGLARNLQIFRDAAHAGTPGMLLAPEETRALSFLARATQPGGVLPSLRVATAIPAYTGRRTWIGHPGWTPDYQARARAVSALFSGTLSVAQARRFLLGVGARYVLADCEPRFGAAQLGALLVSEHSFGCVTVYQLAIETTVSTL